jgi:hypothetical protein
MVLHGDVCLKQWAVTEFFVAEKASVTNIHKQLQNVYSVNAIDKSTVSRWASQIAGSERPSRAQ